MSGIASSDKADEAVASFPRHEQRLSTVPLSESKRRRLLGGILTATCLYLFLQFSWRHNLLNSLTIKGNRQPTFQPTYHGLSEKDFTLEHCLQESDWSPPQVWYPDPTSPGLVAPQFHSFAALDIPVTSTDLASTMLSFVSRYPGTFKMITSPHQAKDSITFNITARYSTPELCTSEPAKICVTSLGRHGKGVGIFNSRQRSGCSAIINRRHGQFNTTLILPESTDVSKPLSILGFRSEVADATQVIGDIGSKVSFKNVILNGNSQPIEIESLSADIISVQSMDGPIRGTFNSTTGLSLSTHNSPILVTVNLNNTGAGTRTGPFFTARTTNSPIKATISLFFGRQVTRPSFSISGHTTNSPVDFTFKAAPIDSVLQVTADTTNSPATVDAPPTFEGSFNLRTTVMEPEINEDPRVVDPSGKGRSRKFQYSNINPGLISGKVYWGEDPSPPQL